MNEQEFRELSAAHALHALSSDEEQTFLAALSAHPEWLHIVECDRESAAAIGEGISAVIPPPAVRSALLEAIADTPQLGADAGRVVDQVEPVPFQEPHVDPSDQPTRRSKRRAGWFALAASLAVLLALAITPWARESLVPHDPISDALASIESAPDASTASVQFGTKGQATLHWSAAEDLAIVVAEGLPSIDANRDFELWIVRGDEPISLGVVQAEARDDIAVIAAGFEPGDAIAVTIEERGGSPTGAPTSDPILVIASTEA